MDTVARAKDRAPSQDARPVRKRKICPDGALRSCPGQERLPVVMQKEARRLVHRLRGTGAPCSHAPRTAKVGAFPRSQQRGVSPHPSHPAGRLTTPAKGMGYAGRPGGRAASSLQATRSSRKIPPGRPGENPELTCTRGAVSGCGMVTENPELETASVPLISNSSGQGPAQHTPPLPAGNCEAPSKCETARSQVADSAQVPARPESPPGGLSFRQSPAGPSAGLRVPSGTPPSLQQTRPRV